MKYSSSQGFFYPAKSEFWPLIKKSQGGLTKLLSQFHPSAFLDGKTLFIQGVSGFRKFSLIEPGWPNASLIEQLQQNDHY